MTKAIRLPGYKTALTGFILAIFVIGLGAFTRLVDAGLGCPDWPGCYGHLLWPNDEVEIAAANRAFPDMPVIDGKAWPEMVHRYFAGLLGLVVLALSIIAVRHRHIANYPFRQPLFMLILVVWQALFGMWTVTLKLWPQVVSIHLLGGFATFTLLAVMVQRLSGTSWRVDQSTLNIFRGLKSWSTLAMIIVIFQIALGGWVASNYAAFGCPPQEFPSCYGSYWPSMDFAQGFNLMQDIGPNYLGGLMDNEARTAIHYVHRIGALVTTLYLVVYAVKCIQVGYSRLTYLVYGLLAVLVMQILLGISNVIFVLPLVVAVAHNMVGAVLLTLVAIIVTQLRIASSAE